MVEAMTFPFADRFAASVLPVYRGFALDQKELAHIASDDGTGVKQYRWPSLVAWIKACKQRPSEARSRGSNGFCAESYRTC